MKPQSNPGPPCATSTFVAVRAGFLAPPLARTRAPEHDAWMREVIDFWWEVVLSC
jgi:hypothetical protein